MDLHYERHHDSRLVPGYSYQIRRISLARRLRFLAMNHDLLQELKFLSSAPDQTSQQRYEIAQLELELSRRLLEECLLALGEGTTMQPSNSEKVDWLISKAPAGLCVEVLASISEELALSSQRRKN